MRIIRISLLCFILVVGIGIRIWYVNKDVEIPPIHTFNLGDEVAIENNIFLDDYDNMKGYTVTVKNAEILSYQDYLTKYNYQDDANNSLFEKDDMFFPEMVYDLHLTIKNTNKTDDPATDSGINFIHYHLNGTDFSLQINDQLYTIANPEIGGMSEGFRLRPESEKDFYLPFDFSSSTIMGPIQVKDITNDTVYLPVSLYPTVNQILIE